MRPKVYQVLYLRNALPDRVNEIVGWPLARAVELCATGICKPVGDDPELLAAIKVYRPGKPQEWQRYLLQPSYFRFHG